MEFDSSNGTDQARPVTTVVSRYHPDSGSGIYIGRPSKWGNPFVIGRDGDRETVIHKYELWLNTQIHLGYISIEDLASLYGKTLVCHCSPRPCHGDVLAIAAEQAHIQLL